MNENAVSLDLTVTLSYLGEGASSTVTVNYAASDETAIAGTDYTLAPGTLTFNPGDTSKTISVGIIDNDNYSNQSVYFTVALSEVSSNATLAAPSTATVNILDNDPAPVADIEIQGVPPDTAGQSPKNNPGGFVQVNANNDNGSALTYTDGTGVPAGSYGIPATRDFAVTMDQLPLANADPDLLQITLQPQNLKAGGPETISLSVSTAGRAQIQLWDSGTKNNQLATPAIWTVANMPASVYVEGLLESAALREVTLTLTILKNNTVVSKDTCTLTVTPVLTNLVITPAKGAVPGIVNDPMLGWIIESSAGIEWR